MVTVIPTTGLQPQAPPCFQLPNQHPTWNAIPATRCGTLTSGCCIHGRQKQANLLEPDNASLQYSLHVQLSSSTTILVCPDEAASSNYFLWGTPSRATFWKLGTLYRRRQKWYVMPTSSYKCCCHTISVSPTPTAWWWFATANWRSPL
jgi:hypothetical protein